MDLKNNTIGQVYTPDYVADFIVRNIVRLLHSFNLDNEKIKNLKVLEPSTGEGVFLEKLLTNNFKNITAYEIDTTLKNNLITKYSNVNFNFNNFLSSDPNEKFDLIIGNPPYLGQNYNARIFQDIVENFPSVSKYFVGNMDLFYFFIHLGILKLKPGGLLSFITTNYWISKSKKTGIKHLKPHITQECYLVQLIDLSGLKVFKDAQGQHNCIFILRKKTEEEKRRRIDLPIEIIQIADKKDLKVPDEIYLTCIFDQIINHKKSPFFKKYLSALTNNDLALKDNWHLFYSNEVNNVIIHIEEMCKKEGRIQFLGDQYSIRNGLILIKDEIFILEENKNIFFDEREVLIKIGDRLKRLTPLEIKRIKRIYKSRSIKQFGYNQEDQKGYLIFLNKKIKKTNQNIEKKFPNLVQYLNQFEEQLRKILKNAKENPANIYYPRRGSHIKQIGKNKMVDLERLYDRFPKIFFKFISQENIFGFCPDQYYATSDTYFLWPKNDEQIYNPYFTLAFLNSGIVKFIYKAKSLALKRSKTKIEREIPLPPLDESLTDDKRQLANFIENITKLIVFNFNVNNNSNENMVQLSEKLKNMNLVENDTFIDAFRCKNIEYFRKVIDKLLFQFFDLDGKQLDYLTKKYYKF